MGSGSDQTVRLLDEGNGGNRTTRPPGYEPGALTSCATLPRDEGNVVVYIPQCAMSVGDGSMDIRAGPPTST